MAKHIKTSAKDNHGNEFSIASTSSDSPLLPVEQLERLHKFRPDIVDFVIAETKAESELRRKETIKINRYVFIEHILGMVFALIIGILGVSGAIYLGLHGNDWLGGIIGMSTIGTLSVAYLKRK